jgi:hyperosmotically inducible protein
MTFYNIVFTRDLLPCPCESSAMRLFAQPATHSMRKTVHLPKEIAMRNTSLLHKSLIAGGAMIAFAGLPLSLVMAQSAPTSSATPQSSNAMQSTGSTPSSNETVPGKVDDTWITTKVKSKFTAAKNVKSSDISVSTTDGAVTLTGSVASTKQKTHVIHLAKQVKGVKSVDASGLTVSGPASSSSSSGQ